MSPSEVEELIDQQPFKPLRLTLASGDQLVVRSEDHPIVHGLSLILAGPGRTTSSSTGPRLVSIPNIVLVEPVAARPGGRRRR